MRARLFLAASILAGVVLAVWLARAYDWSAVFAATAGVGLGGAAALCALRVFSIALCGLGWAWLVRPQVPGVGRGAFLLLRWVREAINVLLPVAQVGGDVVGGALLRRWGVGAGLCGAGVLVDLLLQTAAQALYTLIGLVLLLRVHGGEAFAGWVAGGLAAVVAGLAGFWLAQRRGMFGALERLMRASAARFAGRDGAETGVRAEAGVQAALDAMHRDGPAMAASFALRLLSWSLGAVEAWIALRCLGYPAGIAQALVIDALGQAVRTADSPVPGAVGVQEGGYVLLGALYGLPAEAALALSLLKRLPDVVLGVPGLLAWAAIQSRGASVLPSPG